MTDYEPTNPQESLPADPGSGPNSASHAGWRRTLSNRLTGWLVAAALLCTVIGLAIALAVSPSNASGQPVPGGPRSGSGGPAAPGSGGNGSNARSGPAAGGSVGTVSAVSTSGFTLSTSGGQKVTINEASSTTYEKGTSSAAASAVTTGEPVLVLGTTNGTTITATQVVVDPTGYSASSSAVVPFQQGAQSAAKQVGQIPANYTEGQGTIVSGTTANKAIEAALASYPGGVVDRVVQLSNGEYEVHT
ncbi:MAG TPA: hypothetical protein VGL39_12930, partial [Jatrophihabitantaceae bacterium]